MNFPERKQFIWSSVLGMLTLSFVFTSIIIIAFVTALRQIMKQRQISEIKTDFINNMTHEFKTPIATISLAADSIASPMILGNDEKVLRKSIVFRNVQRAIVWLCRPAGTANQISF